MLPSRADTFLAIERTLESRELGMGIDRAKEDGFELWDASTMRAGSVSCTTHLVHTSIREKERRIVIWDGGRGRDVGVVLGLEVVEELLADACSGP